MVDKLKSISIKLNLILNRSRVAHMNGTRLVHTGILFRPRGHISSVDLAFARREYHHRVNIDWFGHHFWHETRLYRHPLPSVLAGPEIYLPQIFPAKSHSGCSEIAECQ
jgi:hypothetical protein